MYGASDRWSDARNPCQTNGQTGIDSGILEINVFINRVLDGFKSF